MSGSVDIGLPDPINLDIGATAGITVTGSSSAPVSMMVLGDAGKPVSVGMAVTGDSSKPLSMLVLGDPNKPLSVGMAITGDPQKPVTAGIELLNLPRLTVESIQKLMSMQISLPGHRQVGIKILGLELFQLCYGGEGKVITEPYVPKDHCAEPFCHVDTRPFPKNDRPNG